MKIEVSKLKGIALDWAVAKCEGSHIANNAMSFIVLHKDGGDVYSTNWSIAGEIIEQNRISVTTKLELSKEMSWGASTGNRNDEDFYGETPLIAAMRCYVWLKFGNDIDIPEELIA